MAGVPVRSSRDSLFSDMPVGVMESAMEGIWEVGMVPPPVAAVDCMVVTAALVMGPSWVRI